MGGVRKRIAGRYPASRRYFTSVGVGRNAVTPRLMQQAIADYGRTLAMHPSSAIDQLDVIEIDGSRPKAWSVRVDLWTVEEGRSDLSLECTLIDRPGDLLAAEVDNLHVR